MVVCPSSTCQHKTQFSQKKFVFSPACTGTSISLSQSGHRVNLIGPSFIAAFFLGPDPDVYVQNSSN